MIRLHMLDGHRKSGSYNTEEHRKKTLEIARESVVLLKNEKRQLPLSISDTKSVLVIGDNAETMHSGSGGSAEIKALYEITPLMGIKMILGGNTQVDFTRGYYVDIQKEVSKVNWQETSLEEDGGKTKDIVSNPEMNIKRKQLREEALKLAKKYDVVIFIGGLNHEQESEGNDRFDMKLPYEQDLLIQELLCVRPDAIIVMVGGSPVEMGEWIDRANTLVWGWYAGMEGGRALAEVLFGISNPSGKLAETFYKSHLDCSAHCVGEFPGDKKVRYREGVFVGYRYNDTFCVEPQFCFGHGLSYTEFLYENPIIYSDGADTFVVCDVVNVGNRTGKETVQVYMSQWKKKNDQPIQELIGFKKVELRAGERRKVKILIEKMLEQCEIRIGSSSRDIRLKLNQNNEHGVKYGSI